MVGTYGRLTLTVTVILALLVMYDDLTDALYFSSSVRFEFHYDLLFGEKFKY